MNYSWNRTDANYNVERMYNRELIGRFFRKIQVRILPACLKLLKMRKSKQCDNKNSDNPLTSRCTYGSNEGNMSTQK